jgi:lipoprotein-anchoring transpeptidase ErfK/SrfK
VQRRDLREVTDGEKLRGNSSPDLPNPVRVSLKGPDRGYNQVVPKNEEKPDARQSADPGAVVPTESEEDSADEPSGRTEEPAESGGKTVKSRVERVDLLIGSELTYVVKRPETLRMVAAKTGVSAQVIAKDNNLDPRRKLQRGMVLRINSRRIVPKTLKDGIVINIPDRTLYLFKEGKLHVSYPVAVGMRKKDKRYTWHTPTGKFRVTSKLRDPTWHIPQSLKQKMKTEGKTVLTEVPPGPKNPLGKYALGTSLAGILIHGTISPESINSFSSHGCVRMLPWDIEKMFKIVKVNTGGEIIYQPVKVAVSEEGRIFLEAHSDVYNKMPDLESAARKLLQEKQAFDRVDWNKVRVLLKNGNGKVEDITL